MAERLRRQQDHEQIVYSREEPFVGVGVRHRAWKFTTELVPNGSADGDDEDGATAPAAPPTRPPAGAGARGEPRHRGERARTGGQRSRRPGPYQRDRLRGISVQDRIMVPGFRQYGDPRAVRTGTPRRRSWRCSPPTSTSATTWPSASTRGSRNSSPPSSSAAPPRAICSIWRCRPSSCRR
ncbi:hypothetical protein NKH77_34360 [Streptomyces sp. M19]